MTVWKPRLLGGGLRPRDQRGNARIAMRGELDGASGPYGTSRAAWAPRQGGKGERLRRVHILRVCVLSNVMLCACRPVCAVPGSTPCQPARGTAPQACAAPAPPRPRLFPASRYLRILARACPGHPPCSCDSPQFPGTCSRVCSARAGRFPNKAKRSASRGKQCAAARAARGACVFLSQRFIV